MAARQSENNFANYQFSSDEVRVLRECNTESFFQRSLPLGTLFGLGAYYGMQYGYLRPNIKYGKIPKVIAGVVIGYFMGKFSYQQKCAEKIMQLPNSKLGQLLRQRKQKGGLGGLVPDQELTTGLALAPFSANTSIDSADGVLSHDQHSGSFSLDLENRSPGSDLDDMYRPSYDKTYDEELHIDPKNSIISYEELRRQNREDYEKRHGLGKIPAESKNSSNINRIPEPQQPVREPSINKYGDTFE